MTTYIEPPISTDPDDLAADAFAFITENYPGWVPNAGNLETWVLEAAARYAAEIGTTAAAVTTAIFRYLGKIIGVLPLDATSASATTTWTVVNNSGYTIPAGTLVQIPDGAGTLWPFAVVADVVIPAGSVVTATGAVQIVAVNTGAASSDLGTPAEAIQLAAQLDYVTGIVLEETTSGGVDAEDDATYLDRLATELQLLTPRPIIPPDFVALALNIAGVERALAIDLYKPAVNELETVTVNATGGTYKLTFSGQQTAAINWNATAAVVQTALEALSNIAPGDVIVTGGPGATAPITVEFTGVYAGTDVAQMTADSTLLTGGTHTATIATTRAGSASSTGNERMLTMVLVDANGNGVGTTIKTATQAKIQALLAINFILNMIDPTVNSIDVSFTIDVADGFDPATTVAAAVTAVTSFLSPANWGMPGGDARGWVDTEIVHRLDLAAVIKDVPGVLHLTILQLAAHGGALGTADVNLTGPAALTTAGTITGAHT